MQFSEYRKKIGTQDDVAKLLNTKLSTLASWEAGISKPKIRMIKTIAQILNISVEDVVSCFDKD